MGTPLYTLLLLLLSVINECSSIQWSSSALKEDAAVYACDDSDLTLSWDVSKTTGETIVDVQWFYQGRSQEMIAILSHGHLNVMPSFSGRVELTANAGLVIHHVTSGERGNYSVEVTGMDNTGHLVTLRRRAIVVIGDGLMTTDGQLHASQMVVAVFSNSTQQWHVVLACGTFTYPDTPPFTVEWTTPSGQSVSSSQYKEGQFLLLLDNPVSGGSYTCRVPHSSASVACLHGNSTDASATVVVDDVKSRLTLLEAENAQLKEHLVDVRDQANAKISLADDKINEANAKIRQANDKINQADAKIDSVSKQTSGRIDGVSAKLSQHLHDETTKRVSFHATNLTDVTPSNKEVLIPTTVLNNQGNGYNPATGKFTAPFSGTYCFMANLFGEGSGHVINVLLVKDGSYELWVKTNFDSDEGSDAASLQAVVYVRAGQSVWLKAFQDNNLFHAYTYANSFSGFLIFYDL